MSAADLQQKAKNHYFDPHLKRETVKILPGEYYVTSEGEMIVTTLGSCIAACIRDTVLGVGGMNHFMLPHSKEGEWAGFNQATRYGNFAMERLINDILMAGGKKNRLEAKLFGGGQMFGEFSVTDVGRQNARFAEEYLRTENIMLMAADVGGPYSRKVYFDPKTGKVMVKKLTTVPNDTIKKREQSYAQKMETPTSTTGDIELFDESNNIDDILFDAPKKG